MSSTPDAVATRACGTGNEYNHGGALESTATPMPLAMMATTLFAPAQINQPRCTALRR